MNPQRFRVEEGDPLGERVSGIMDERPELDSGRRSHCVIFHACRAIARSTISPIIWV
jgi:hypothetical protein